MSSNETLSPSEILALFAGDAPGLDKDGTPIDFDPHTGRVEEATAHVQSLVDAICDLLLSGTAGPVVSLQTGLRGTTQWSLYRYRQSGWTSTKSGRKVDASAGIASEILDDPTELVRACFHVATIHVGVQIGMPIGSNRGRYFKALVRELCEPIGLEFHKVDASDNVHGLYGYLPKSFRPLVERLSVRKLKTRGCRPEGMTALQVLEAIQAARGATVQPEQKRATATCSNGTELGKLELSSVKGGYFAAACTCGCGEGFAAAENDKGTIIAVPTPLADIMAARTAAAA